MRTYRASPPRSRPLTKVTAWVALPPFSEKMPGLKKGEPQTTVSPAPPKLTSMAAP